VTETTTERRIVFSPEIDGRRIGEARNESDVLLEIARKVRPEWADKLSFRNMAEMRKEIARIVPFYEGIQNLNKKGDQFQYGGEHLCADWNFPTEDGKAHFGVFTPAERIAPEGMFRITTRRGKQFNSIIQEQKDMLTGAKREAVFMNHSDALRLGLQNGDKIRVHNEHGEMMGHVFLAKVRPSNLQLHWPEGNVLLPRGCRSPEAGIPDYNGVAKVEKV